MACQASQPMEDQTLCMFEGEARVSQRPDRDKKRRESAAGGQDIQGALFLLLLLGKQKKERII